MNLSELNKNISVLRKEKGVTQEQLAKAIGVSAQAVSKWENGGVPDVALLPKIADFFGVSLDYLFGRTSTDYGNIYESIFKEMQKTDNKEKFNKAFELCWAIEQGFFGDNIDEITTVEQMRKEVKDETRYKTEEELQLYSSAKWNNGYTQMGVSPNSYFLIVPDLDDGNSFINDDYKFTELFADLSNEDFFNALVFLYSRKNDKSFSSKYLQKKLSLTDECFEKVITLLKKYRLLYSQPMELEDGVQECYSLSPNVAFPALIIFAREFILPPYRFHCNWSARRKPYFY